MYRLRLASNGYHQPLEWAEYMGGPVFGQQQSYEKKLRKINELVIMLRCDIKLRLYVDWHC